MFHNALFAFFLFLFLASCAKWEKTPGQPPIPPSPTARPVWIEELGKSAHNIFSGDTHNCALLTDKTLRCWGDNESGELGVNSTSPLSKIPQPVIDPQTRLPLRFSEVTLGKNVSCGFSLDHTPYCWGDNGLGQLGTPLKGEPDGRLSPVPRKLQLQPNTKSFVSRHGRQCVIAAEGAPLCWGRTMWIDVKTKTDSHGMEYSVGEIKHASGVHNTPTHVNPKYSKEFKGPWDGVVEIAPTLEDICVNQHGTLNCLKNQNATTTNVNSLTGGGDHLCVLTRSRKEIRCAGTNALGQLGVSQPADGSDRLINVTGLPPGRFAKIAAGTDHTCALATPSGDVFCWGSNEKGQLGDPAIDGWSARPVKVKNLTKAVDISSGAQHSCAIVTDGTTWCWGDNSRGQLGSQGAYIFFNQKNNKENTT